MGICSHYGPLKWKAGKAEGKMKRDKKKTIGEKKRRGGQKTMLEIK